MSAITPTVTPRGLLQHSAWDALLVLLALAQGGLLFAVMVGSVLSIPIVAIPLIAIGLWWNSNTISHNFIHNPFFRSPRINFLFAVYLSVLLGFPHALWRSRHLAHHSGAIDRKHHPAELVVQSTLVVTMWIALAMLMPAFLTFVYLPAWLLGLTLCAMQGHFEHSRGTTSCYGMIYNWLFFKDGFHVEHHKRPREHWTRLEKAGTEVASSRWPPVLRWLDIVSLESLERVALRSQWIQRFLLSRHERAFAALLSTLPPVHRVGIVGGGLFPRTAIVLRKLLPDATLTVIDLSRRNLTMALPLLPDGIKLLNEKFDPERHGDFELIVFPLSLRGDRAALYHKPPAQFACIHDWIWRRRGKSIVISAILLKRLNLVQS